MAKERDYDETQGAPRSNPYDELPQNEYDDDMMEPDEGDDEGQGGFLSSTGGRVLLVVIIALLVIVLALVIVRAFVIRDDGTTLPSEQADTPVPALQEQTQAPSSIVFAPAVVATDTPKPT